MNELRLYVISPKDPKKWGGYDTYDSAVVAAANPEDAVTINPSEYLDDAVNGEFKDSSSWPDKTKEVEAEFIGFAKPGTERGVILGSFNAG